MSSSVLPWQWVIESLAGIPDAGTSILSALVDRFPDVLADSSGAVRERLALRYLEECSGMSYGETPPAVATNAPSTSASAAKINAPQTCEEVLRSKVATSNDHGKGKAGIDDGDLHQFILLKRATLPKSSIELLKEKILSYQHDFSYLKECKGLPKVPRSCINHPTSSSHRVHDIKKIIKTMKNANPWMKKLAITRKYRKLKNLTNAPLIVREALQKVSTSQQPLAEQYAPDDEKRNKQSNVDGTCNEFQFFRTEKTKSNPCEGSAEFHDVEMQSRKDNFSGYAPASNGDPDNFKVSRRSGQQSQKQNVLHDDRADFQGEEAGSDCGDEQLSEQRSILQPSSAQGFCIKCGRSGQVLNCRGDGCSRAIHERCIGLLASVEKNDLFYCPICAYRNARMMYEKSKRKAKEARRNLFSFYDVCPAAHVQTKKSSKKIMIGSDQVSVNDISGEHPELLSNQQFRNSSGGKKHDDTQNVETSKSTFAGHDKQEITQNQLNGEDDVVQDTPIKLGNDTVREHENTGVTEGQQPVNDIVSDKGSLPCDVNTSHERNGDACVVNSRNEDFSEHLQGECDHNAKRKALASQISDRFAKRDRREKSVRTDNYQGAVENQQIYNSSSRELRKSIYRQNQCLTAKGPTKRRTKLIWKPEEEEVLEEAMQKIPKNDDGSIPWIKILEYGRRVLHESRTPIDLKDKWRNMQKKEAKPGV